jgi:ADP-ribose pyrophosphatase YjhB (NUDIX family)
MYRSKSRYYGRYHRANDKIESHGVIAFAMKKDADGATVPHFLVYQRRDSYAYIMFIRGRYDPVYRHLSTHDKAKSEGRLKELFSQMSKDERERIQNNITSFKTLWDDFWVNKKTQPYVSGFKRAAEQFESIQADIPRYLRCTTASPSHPKWGFPRGRKDDKREDSRDCAMREFTEETKIDIFKLGKEWDQNVYIEDYTGTDDKAYKTCYYAYEFKECIHPPLIETDCPIRKTTISEEAMRVEWLPYCDIVHLIEPRMHCHLRSINYAALEKAV